MPLFTCQTQKKKETEHCDRSLVATTATLNARVISTGSEISRWSIGCACSAIVTLLYMHKVNDNNSSEIWFARTPRKCRVK